MEPVFAADYTDPSGNEVVISFANGIVAVGIDASDGRPTVSVVIPWEKWREMNNIVHGGRLREEAATPPKVCAPGVSTLTTHCGTQRIQLGHQWWPKVGAPDEVTCPRCRERLAEAELELVS